MTIHQYGGNGESQKTISRPSAFMVQQPTTEENITQFKEQQKESSNQAVAMATQIFPYSVTADTDRAPHLTTAVGIGIGAGVGLLPVL